MRKHEKSSFWAIGQVASDPSPRSGCSERWRRWLRSPA